MPGRHAPKRLLEEVRQKAERGWPSGLVVLSGDSTYHIDAAQRAILEALVPAGAGEYGLTVYGDEKIPIGTVVAACRSMGMFSERRVVLVRDLERLDGEPEPLLEYAADPAPDSHLIVRAPKLDRRRKLHKALTKLKMFLHFEIPEDPLATVGEIEQLASEQGVRMRPDAKTMLAHVCGGDIQRAAVELAKIAAWLGDEKRDVRVEDLREIVGGEGAMSGWELANAIVDRDRSRALRAARKLVEAGDEPIKVVGGIAWWARKMLSDRNTRHYDMQELLAFPAHLLAADRALKSRQIAPGAVLESLVDRMIGTRGP